MDFLRLHTCFHENLGLARAAIAASDPKAPVRSCPGWTVADLTHHLAEVYLHKADCVRLGAFPEPWPPERIDPDPLTALDDAVAELEQQFVAHRPGHHAPTWYRPDQTVGFWMRRMAHETVIHRVDAELAAGIPVSPIPADLALDGIDEILKLFIAYGSVTWRDQLGSLLDDPDQHHVLIATETTDRELARAWTVTAHPDSVSAVDASPNEPDAALTVFGQPAAVLRWLWNRPEPDTVHIAGDPLLLVQFQALKHALTQ
ncbi:MAG TPA: maleylpyruvate isomerase family mycothiol-dependent enzyme [Actinocrinis sp.]|nr:maleylpyruvate isomerase family mycothiol-dependent enzyme [Actinocrinis sp.]